MATKRRRNKGIIGVALSEAGKFLGFVDGRGKIRKGRVKRVRVGNPSTAPATVAQASNAHYANRLAKYYTKNGYRVVLVKRKFGQYEVRVYDTERTK